MIVWTQFHLFVKKNVFLLQTSVRRIKVKRMWRSHTSQPTFIHMKDPMSSTAQTKNVSHSVWPGGKILTTGNTHSSCHQSKSPCSSTVDLDRITIVWCNWSSNWGSTVGLSGQQAIYFGFCVCTIWLKPHYSVLCHAGRTTPLWTTLSMWARPAAPALSLWVFVWRSGCLPPCVSTLVRVRSSGGQMAWCPWQKPTPAEPFVAPDTSRPLLQACLYRPTPSALKHQSVSQKQTLFVHMHQLNTHLPRFSPSHSGAFWCTKPSRPVGLRAGLTKLCCGSSHLAQVGPAGSASGWCGSTLRPRRTI